MIEFNDTLPRLLDIKNDFVFKLVFGDENNTNVLISFLNAVLRGHPKIVDVQVLNNESPKLVKNGLGVRFDIKAKVSDDTFVDIEIQCRNTHDIAERAIQYLARMLTENTTNNDVTEEARRDYHYPKVIGIWVLGQNVTNRNSAISEAYMTFKKNDRDDYQIMSDKARVLFIELKKFKPQTIDKQHMLDLWLSFLQNPENTEVQNIDKDVDQAFRTLNFVSADEKTRAELIHLEESRRDTDSERINAERLAEERGHKKGREEGREEERRKNAINIKNNVHTMKADGLPDKIIAKYLGITEDEVEKLLKK